jgi:hypothetical protein
MRPKAMPATPGSKPGDRSISVHSAREWGEKAPRFKKKKPKDYKNESEQHSFKNLNVHNLYMLV